MQDKTRGYGDQDIVLPDETRRAIAELVNGDARRALNTLEMMADMAEADDSGKRVLLPALLTEIAGERSARFDNKGDRFYDLISALHKSVRGSAPDAALYWYARIITAGGDPLYVARRCRRLPRKMWVMPIRARCRSPLPRGIVSPASARLKAKGRSRRLSFISPARRRATPSIPPLRLRWPTRERPDYDVPVHLRNAPTKLMKEMGYGGNTAMPTMSPMPMLRVKCTSCRKSRKRAIIIRQIVVWKARLAKSSPGWLNRIKIAPQNATASVNVAVRLSLNMMLRYHGVDDESRYA